MESSKRTKNTTKTMYNILEPTEHAVDPWWITCMCFIWEKLLCPTNPCWWGKQKCATHLFIHKQYSLFDLPLLQILVHLSFQGHPFKCKIKRNRIELETEREMNRPFWLTGNVKFWVTLQPYVEALRAWRSHGSCRPSVSNGPRGAWTAIFAWGALNKGKPHFDAIISYNLSYLKR